MRTAGMLALSLLPIGVVAAVVAFADPVAANPPGVTTVTVDGTDYPVCAFEDCSDQPNQVGVWTDRRDGRSWLIVGDQTYFIAP